MFGGVRHTGALVVLTLACMTAARPVSGQAAGRPGEADRDEITAAWATLDERWNQGDAPGFSELFTREADFEFVDRGQSLRGRSTIHAHFDRQFRQVAPDIRHRTTLGDIHDLAPDVRAVDGRVHILRVDPAADAPGAVVRTFAIFGIMVHGGASWEIRLLRVYELDGEAE